MDDLGGRFVSLTTYRRDGTPVKTPVWFVVEDRHLWIWTRSDSGKVRRIAHNDDVTVQRCNSRGVVSGAVLPGKAGVIGPTCAPADRLFAQKYGVVLRVWRVLHALLRRLGRGHAWLYLKVGLDPADR